MARKYFSQNSKEVFNISSQSINQQQKIFMHELDKTHIYRYHKSHDFFTTMSSKFHEDNFISTKCCPMKNILSGCILIHWENVEACNDIRLSFTKSTLQQPVSLDLTSQTY